MILYEETYVQYNGKKEKIEITAGYSNKEQNMVNFIITTNIPNKQITKELSDTKYNFLKQDAMGNISGRIDMDNTDNVSIKTELLNIMNIIENVKPDIYNEVKKINGNICDITINNSNNFEIGINKPSNIPNELLESFKNNPNFSDIKINKKKKLSGKIQFPSDKKLDVETISNIITKNTSKNKTKGYKLDK